MDPFSAPSTCRISVHAAHHLRTVAVREHALIWIHRGTKTLLSAQKPRVFRAGEAVVMLQGSEWDVINDPRPDTRYEATVLQFGDDALAALDALAPSAHPARAASSGCAAPPMDEELAQSVRRAVATLHRPGATPALQLHRTVEVLLLLAERDVRLESRAALGWPERLRRLVAQRPHADWSVDALSAACHVSTATLRRRLATKGCTASDIVRETRLETGLALLQTTALPIGEIALRCGYESHSRFTAAFRTRFGFAPSQLRDPAQDLTLSG